MAGDWTASAIYLVLLGSVLAFFLVRHYRGSGGLALRHVGLWAAIFAAAALGFVLYDAAFGPLR